MNYSYFSLLVIVLVTYTINGMDSLVQKTENNVLQCIERRLTTVFRALTIPNDALFKNEKPVVIDQFPKAFKTIEKQTLSMISEVIKKLAYKGLSLDDVQQSKLFFYKITEGIIAFNTLKDQCPILANKTTLQHWKSKRVDNSSKIFMTIVARKKPFTKKPAHL